MFNVPIKTIVLPASLGLALAACSGNSSETKATDLYQKAEAAFEHGQYQTALKLIDSIDNSLPDAIEVRKQCRLLKPQVVERYAAQNLSQVDSLLALSSYRGDSLKHRLALEPNAVEAYYVGVEERGVNPYRTSGLHARISADNHFYLVASCPASVNPSRVRLSVPGGGSVESASVAYDGERNTRDTGAPCQIITFTEAESAPLAQFVSDQATSAPITISFQGASGSTFDMALSSGQRQAIADCYMMRDMVASNKTLHLQRTKYERQLEVARRQLATVADK